MENEEVVGKHKQRDDACVDQRKSKLLDNLRQRLPKVERAVGKSLYNDCRRLDSHVSASAADKRDEKRDGGIVGKIALEIAENPRVRQSAYHSDDQPRQACFCLVENLVVGLHVGGKTGSQLIVALGLLTGLVHHVVEGDASHKTSDAVDNRHNRQVVFLKREHHVVERLVGLHGVGVGLHHMFYL